VPAATNGPTRSRPPVRQPSIRLATPDETVAPSTPGHEWRRVDLHIHTPASVDYQQPAATPLDILRRAAEQALDVIAFTDHNSVRGYADMWREIEDLELLEYLKRLNPEEAERLEEYRRLLDQILVLPGFEFTATFGFHVLAIFPEGTSVRMMEHLLLHLGVPEEKFGSGEVGATSDVLRVYETLAEHGALVIGAHVNSTHGVAMQGLRFGGQTKIAYTQDPHLHALEVTDLALGPHRRSTARFFSGTKPEYPRQMHCIQGSDAHRLTPDPERESQLGIGDRATEVLLPEVSFDAIKALFQSDHFDWTRPFVAAPADPIKAARLEGNSQEQSFHESLTTKRTGTAHVLRDVVAFANSGGGTIFVGASAAEKRPVHGVEDADSAAEALRSEISAQVMPPVEATVEVVESDAKAVLVVRVAEGREKPHALLPSAILVRRGAETEAASRDEIVAMVTAATAPASAPSPSQPAPSPRRQGTNGSGRAAGRSTPNSPPTPLVAQRDPSSESGRRNGKRMAVGDEPIAAPPVPGGASLDVFEEAVEADPIAPKTGVEVVHAYEQDGVVYYTLRDLRDHKLIHNLTRDTDRRLFRSAIAQHEEQAVDEEKVRWLGDFGLWRTYRPRGGERRYHLVYAGDGDLRVFYGVSEAGMDGPWWEFLDAGA
jgi:hypothetical protein